MPLATQTGMSHQNGFSMSTCTPACSRACFRNSHGDGYSRWLPAIGSGRDRLKYSSAPPPRSSSPAIR